MVTKGKERATPSGPLLEPAPKPETRETEALPSVANSATLEQGSSGPDLGDTETLEQKLA